MPVLVGLQYPSLLLVPPKWLYLRLVRRCVQVHTKHATNSKSAFLFVDNDLAIVQMSDIIHAASDSDGRIGPLFFVVAAIVVADIVSGSLVVGVVVPTYSLQQRQPCLQRCYLEFLCLSLRLQPCLQRC